MMSTDSGKFDIGQVGTKIMSDFASNSSKLSPSNISNNSIDNLVSNSGIAESSAAFLNCSDFRSSSDYSLISSAVSLLVETLTLFLDIVRVVIGVSEKVIAG